MALPIVMPANNNCVHKLNILYPGRLGLLMGPGSGGLKNPRGLPFGVDNGKFPIWSKGGTWEESLFINLLDRIVRREFHPNWVVVPDVITKPQETLQEWKLWAPRIQEYGFPLALAVQDGMLIDDILPIKPQPDILFVGGSYKWKRRTMSYWCRHFPRVHIGRVNSEPMLWSCQYVGAESVDGTGWNKGGDKSRIPLIRYLERSSKGLGKRGIKSFWERHYESAK